MSLKQMIDEAKMLADSRPASIAASMEDINMYRRSSDAKTPIQSDFEGRRSQSAVSVIDQEAEREAERAAQRRWEEEQQRLEQEEEEMLRLQEEEMRRRMAAMQQPEPEAEPVPMSRRVVTASSQQERIPTPPEEAPPPPLEELEPPPVAPVRASPAKPATPGRRGAPGKLPSGAREPSVGADRYEDIIVEARKRSSSRGPNSRMGSRTSSTLDFRSSQNEFPSNGGSKVDINSMRSSIAASNRSEAGDLEMPKV